jgi:hypothetical protein
VFFGIIRIRRLIRVAAGTIENAVALALQITTTHLSQRLSQ